jgi:DMSO/TMAO reductase YedYZ molybdopterin-dependent catalytic subunit
MSNHIIRSQEPEVIEYPFSELDAFLTAAERFFVRNHFPIPQINEEEYRLSVAGRVRKPLTLSLDCLRALPSQTVTTTMECAGNNRTFLPPETKGVKWGLGAVGTADWTGVRLADVLSSAQVEEEVVEILLEGADQGIPDEEPKPTGPIHYARSLPLAKAMQGDVLLAYAMNGQQLTAKHGFPLRAIVPGWYGMASVKWLTRILAVDAPFGGYFQTIDYAYWEMQNGHPVRTPLAEMLVKSLIARPKEGEVLACSSEHSIVGAAWSGAGAIAKVEVSVDGGQSWAQAELAAEARPNAWRLWQCRWQAPAEPGEYTLMARATDERGNVQEMSHDRNRGNYMINFCLPIKVTVQ